jgi:hypothetical protein
MWIESHQSLADHPKLYELCGLMEWETDLAIGKLHRFWWWCLDYAPDGNLGRFNDTQIALGMGVAIPQAKRLVEALVQSRWIDRQPYFRVHDWWDYVGSFLRIKYKNKPGQWEAVKLAYLGPDSLAAKTATASTRKPDRALPLAPAVGSPVATPATTPLAPSLGEVVSRTTDQPDPPDQPTPPDQPGAGARAEGVVVAFPSGFPGTEDVAIRMVLDAIPPDFIRKIWNQAASRNGRDARQVPIGRWPNHVKAAWTYEQERIAKENHYGTHQHPDRPRVDRAQNTLNRGLDSQFAELG